MCVVSMVHDYYWHKIPDRIPLINTQSAPFTPLTDENIANSFKDLEKILKDYRKAVEAAKQVDELTNQFNCIEPEKAKLELRVAKLETELAELKLAMNAKNATGDK